MLRITESAAERFATTNPTTDLSARAPWREKALTYIKEKWIKKNNNYCGPYLYEYENEYVSGRGSVPRYVRYLGKAKCSDKARVEQIVMEYNLSDSNLKGCIDLYNSEKWFIAFDTETTGLSYDKCNDRIIELAAQRVRIKAGDLELGEAYHEYVDPQRKIPPMIQKLTGITPQMVRGKRTKGPVIRDFRKFVGSKPMIAHNAQFDLRFVNGTAKDHGVKQFPDALDTLKLTRTVWGMGHCHKLEECARREGVKVEGAYHSAATDVQVCASIFHKLVERVKRDLL